MTKMEETALVNALGKSVKGSVKGLASKSLDQRKLLIRDHITKAFDQRADAGMVEVIAKLLSDGQAERPEATEVVQIFGQLGHVNTCCCIPWSSRGRTFISGILIIAGVLCVSASNSSREARAEIYSGAILAVSFVPLWGWMVLGARGTRRAVRLVCFQFRGDSCMDAGAMWRALEDSDIGLFFAFGWPCIALFVNDTFIRGGSVRDTGFLAASCCLLWLNAIRLYRKRGRAERQVAALQGLDADQVVVV